MAVKDKLVSLEVLNLSHGNLDGKITSANNKIGEIKADLSVVEDAFETTPEDVTPTTFTTGKYINMTGEEVDAETKYCAYTVGLSIVGKTLYISGSAWYNVRPYVFVGESGTISYASEGATSPTQYTDLEFVPSEEGTLYVNAYTGGSTDHEAQIYYYALTSTVKVASLPVDDIGDAIVDVVSYSIVDLGNLTSSKGLNGNTGELIDSSNSNEKVTGYISVDADTYYLVTTEANWNRGLYVWYDSNYAYISGVKASPGSTYTHLYGEKVKSPSNAAYIRIGYIYQSPYPFPFLMKGEMLSIYDSKKWTGKNWAVIGDSLSASYVYTGVHYFELISGLTGISCTNLSVAGSGYAKGTNRFIEQALNIPSDSDIITFFGSGNDASAGLELGTATDSDTTTVAGCINTAIDNAMSIDPLIPIGIITPTPWKNNMPYDNGWMESYATLLTEICNNRSIPCLDLYHCSGLDTNNETVIANAYSKDNGGATHLDETGHKIIAPKIKAFLETLLL